MKHTRERVFGDGRISVYQEITEGVFQVPEIHLHKAGELIERLTVPEVRCIARELGRAADRAEIWDVFTGKRVEDTDATE